jgi:hypothetical protein
MGLADADGRTPLDLLYDAFEEYKARPLPKLGRLSEYARDADIDLFEEDADLAGLVSLVLAGRPLPVDVIILDRSIDTRLSELARVSRSPVVRRMITYREAMRDLAELLSTAAAVPLRD